MYRRIPIGRSDWQPDQLTVSPPTLGEKCSSDYTYDYECEYHDAEIACEISLHGLPYRAVVGAEAAGRTSLPLCFLATGWLR